MAPLLKWKRRKTFLISSMLALVAFIPFCAGIMFVADTIRFGYCEFQSYDEAQDFRAERFLPTAAIDIKMHKLANGYRARYSISESDFHAYLNELWDKYGGLSAVERGGTSNEGSPAIARDFESTFADLGWKSWSSAIIYYSPTEADGGGATYYVDGDAGIVFQRTGYW
jgi:hypothetical protein